MKKITFITFCFLFFNLTFSQENMSQEDINSLTPIYPDCENSLDTYKCYKQNIGNLILSKLNNDESITLDKIEIDVTLKTEVDGKTSVLFLKANDKKIEKKVSSALKKIPILKPIFSKKYNENKSSSSGFYIVIVKNPNNDSYEVFEKE
jgi:hypothetical protein